MNREISPEAVVREFHRKAVGENHVPPLLCRVIHAGLIEESDRSPVPETKMPHTPLEIQEKRKCYCGDVIAGPPRRFRLNANSIAEQSEIRSCAPRVGIRLPPIGSQPPAVTCGRSAVPLACSNAPLVTTPVTDTSRVIAGVGSVWYDGVTYMGMGSNFSYTFFYYTFPIPLKALILTLFYCILGYLR